MSLLLWDDALMLQRRLEALGHRTNGVVEHENRTVMVSQVRGGPVRIHRGYIYAPDRVLRAVVEFLGPRTPRERIRKAQRVLLEFPVEEFVPLRLERRSHERTRPGDDAIFQKLRDCYRRFNARHFGNRLNELPFRLSGRMRSRLGELVLDTRGRRAKEIALSRRHIRRDAWEEVEHTLLHEMVHQWQAQEGLAVDHGPTFRRKAREVGVEPKAKRYVATKRKVARYE